MKKSLILFILLYGSQILGQHIIVEQNHTVEELVRDVLVNSSCAETSNYTSSTGTAFGVNGIGYFNSNGGRFGYREGIVISSGNAKDAEGPNINIKTSGTLEWPGDPDLSTITSTSNLYNASYISFDFIPQTNRISFNFLFASEEYTDAFQCVYSDVFAFILTDSSGNSTNLALVPDSEDRVSATTIRPGVPDECGARNNNFFGGINGSNSGISMTGQTKSLVAESEVNPGETYTIKLVIADNLDAELDSAVFLEAGSFSIDVSLGDNRTVSGGNPLCVGEIFTMDATAFGAQHYRWYRNGQHLPHFDDIEIVDVSVDGIYEVEVEFSATCLSRGRVEIEYVSPPQIDGPPLNLNACDFDGDGTELIDLTENTAALLGAQNPSIYRVYYYNSLADAENFENVIGRPNSYTLTQNQETIFARVSSGRSCYETASFTINLQQLSFTPTLEEEYLLCLDETGIPIEPRPVLATGLSQTDYSFTWYRNSISVENQIPNETSPSITASQSGTYFVEIESILFNCTSGLSTTVFSVEPPTLFEVELLSDLFADNHIASIKAEGNSSYLYSVDDSAFTENFVFENLAPGKHIAYVQDTYECSVLSKPFMIVDYPRFFTPNGDGVNDTWQIVGMFEIGNPEITIFDRFGSIQHQFTGDIGWDGTRNGSEVPSSDYWFKLSYDNEEGLRKEYKSHFTLKR